MFTHKVSRLTGRGLCSLSISGVDTCIADPTQFAVLKWTCGEIYMLKKQVLHQLHVFYPTHTKHIQKESVLLNYNLPTENHHLDHLMKSYQEQQYYRSDPRLQ